MRNRVRFGLCAAASAAVFGVLGAGVAGATPNSTQYDNPATTAPGAPSKPTVTGSTKGAKATSKPKPVANVIKTTQPAKQGLPFTGLNLLVFFAIGGAMMAAGLFLRLLGRRRTGA